MQARRYDGEHGGQAGTHKTRSIAGEILQRAANLNNGHEVSTRTRTDEGLHGLAANISHSTDTSTCKLKWLCGTSSGHTHLAAQICLRRLSTCCKTLKGVADHEQAQRDEDPP